MTQDGDPEAKKEEESLPEVEAELVSEAPPSEDAFDDDAPPRPSSPDADESDAEADAPQSGDISGSLGAGEKRKSTLTPGVLLFFAFVVVALIAFGLWRFQMRPGVEAPPAAHPPTHEAEQGAASGNDIIASEPAEKKEAAALSDLEPATEKKAEVKIENLPADGVAATPPPEDASGFLPPVPDAGVGKVSNMAEDGLTPAPATNNPSADEIATAAQPPKGDSVAENSAAIAATPLPTDQQNMPENAAAVPERNALQAEIETLKASLQAAEARNAAQADQITRLQTELKNLNSAARSETASLRAELQNLRNDGAQQSARQMKASFARAALTRAADQGVSFEEELNAVAEFDPAARAVLGDYAQTGVKSDVALRKGFDEAAREALAAAGQAKAGGGFAGLVARAKSMVSVRPARPMSGDKPGAVLSRAEHALERGDVSFALQQLEALPSAAQEAMASWMADARARAEVDEALAGLAAPLAGKVE